MQKYYFPQITTKQHTFCWVQRRMNEYAGIKFPINLKHPKKLLLMRILAQKVSIYIRHKKTYKKTKEDSLQNLGVIVIGCIIFQSKLFSCCPKTSAKKLLVIHGTAPSVESFLRCFPKSLYRVLATNQLLYLIKYTQTQSLRAAP